MSWLAFLGLYLGVLVFILVLTAIGLRKEPTVHGQGIGWTFGIVFALLWPIALPVLIACAAWAGLTALREWLIRS